MSAKSYKTAVGSTFPLVAGEGAFPPPSPEVSELIDALEQAGYEAWIVGGWVRDSALGCPDHDVDVCTSALWQEVADLARSHDWAVHETGIKHGTVTLVVRNQLVEVTTYRVESNYSDLRHPDSVEFVRDVREDLARRDFTINAMAYHPKRGLLDPFDGMGDLCRGLIRCVGNPQERFAEDALRVLRAVRFAARMGFEIESATQAALDEAAPSLSAISSERIGQELDGILATGRGAWALRTQTKALICAVPELAPMVGFDQKSPYHAYDVLEHTARVMGGVEAFSAGLASNELRWAALLHDVAKPACATLDENGRGHFYGHPDAGAKQAEKMLARMAIPTTTIRAATTLIRMHDYTIHPDMRSIRRNLLRIEAQVPGRAFPLLHELFILKRADAMGKHWKYCAYASDVDEIEQVLRTLRHNPPALHERELVIGGADVMEVLGIEPSPRVGEVLRTALNAVHEGELANEREALMSWLEHQL